jgi:undecaprenyl-diphosphatase
MDWLRALDVDLFRFVNGTLSNPVFDQIMPFVSRNPFGGPLRWPLVIAIVIFGAIVIRRRLHRIALCAAMAGIAIGVADGVICRNLKHAIGRPRPFNVLADVKTPGKYSPSPLMEERARERRPLQDTDNQKNVQRTGTIPPNPPAVTGNSMPSAHAANWFAGTMVAFFYFRKSIRVMLPLACLVSFSRVYNGVHYPSDVLAGAILGAGTAVAVLWLLNTLWQWSAPKCCPQLYASMPSLTSFKS